MKKAAVIEKLIKEKGYSVRSFAQKCEIPESTLYTILKKGAGRASVNNVSLICRNLGITVEELEEMAADGNTAKPAAPSYEDVEHLIARNGKDFSIEQKMQLIKLLSEIDNPKEV